MKVRLESAKCDGIGTCAVNAPEVFALDEWGYAEVIGDGSVDETQVAAVRRAVLECPVHAIHLVEDEQDRSVTPQA